MRTSRLVAFLSFAITAASPSATTPSSETGAEVACDRGSSFGPLDRGLDEATDRGWVFIDMAADWKRVFPAID